MDSWGPIINANLNIFGIYNKKYLTLLVFFKPKSLSVGIWSEPSRDAALLYTPFFGTYFFPICSLQNNGI